MPEALAVLVVVAVAIAAWVGAWLQARKPANYNPREEFERLRHHATWLEQRIDTARREGWGESMIENLSVEHELTVRQMSALRSRKS